MDIRISPSEIYGKVNIPSSKSALHRLLIACSLCDSPQKIVANGYGNDILVTIDCLNALGANIVCEENVIQVTPIAKPIDNVTLNVEESGSTLRFLLPIVAALGVNATFKGKDSLAKRPIKAIVDLLKKGGIKFDRESLPFTINGKLNNGKYSIDGSVSSQYITGLIFALSIVDGESSLEITNYCVSRSYIDLTLNILKKFDVDIVNANPFLIKGGKIFHSEVSHVTEGDWSSACFMIGLAALCGEIEIDGLDFNSTQGDRIILALLDKMQADYIIENGSLKIKQSKLLPIDFSVKDCPDIAPILAILLSNANGKSVLQNVDRLATKESDRLNNIIEILELLGIRTEYGADSLTIYGNETKYTRNIVILDGYNDHRLALSSIVELSKIGGIAVGVECMSKSYPDFLKDYEKVGGKYEILK